MSDQSFEHVDAGRRIDWGRTSADYDRYRPGPPNSFYERLLALGVGHPDQRILDLGTGTGLLARRFAMAGATVCGLDVSEGQLEMAAAAAARDGQSIDFRLGSAESLPFDASSFDVVSANQCWMYFDLKQTIPEVLRVLTPHGSLLVSHFSFMPRLDRVVAASEALVLEHNPDWSGADWDGVLPAEPAWSVQAFELVGLFVYDEAIPFTRESWRGRMRALRGIAASLSEKEVAAFDQAHEVMLNGMVPEEFHVQHRVHAQIFKPRNREVESVKTM